MSFYGALFVWFVIAALMVACVVWAMSSVIGLVCLAAALLVFFGLFAAIGCASH